MRGQVSMEIMISIFLSLLIALSVSAMLAKATGIYGSEMALEKSYVMISNRSVNGLEGICACYAVR